MRTFRDISIKRKLTAIIMLTSTIVLLLASGAFVTNAVITFRRSMVEKLSTLAAVIGSNSTASLAFNDQDSANETLAALAAEPHITSACVYTKDGNILAKYPTNGNGVLCRSKEDGHHFRDDHLHLFKRIVLDGDTLGMVYVQSDLQGLYSRLRWYAGICGIVMLTSIFVAYLLSSKLQRLISKPILHLTRTMKVV